MAATVVSAGAGASVGMGGEEHVLPGPKEGEIDALLCTFIGERGEGNSVLYDLAHRTEVGVDVIKAGIRQRAAFPGMRGDIDGLSPLHILALQGKVTVLNALRPAKFGSLGGRGVFHFLALRGKLHPSADDKKDEYGGTARDIYNLVKRKEGVPMCAGMYQIEGAHIPATELLKIWFMAKPLPLFDEVRTSVEKFVSSLRQIEGAIVFGRSEIGLGIEARAARDIPRETIFEKYIGEFASGAFCGTLRQADLIEFPAQNEIYSGSEWQTEDESYFDGVVDAKKFGGPGAFINDGLPNAIFILTPGVDGAPFLSKLMSVRDIRRGEALSVCYQEHPVRLLPEYIEPEEAKEERRKVIEALVTKSSFKSLNRYETSALGWIISTPYLLFRWIKNGEITKDQLQNLLGLAAELEIEESPKSVYIDVLNTLIPDLNEVQFSAFVNQWVEPVLSYTPDASVPKNYQRVHAGIAVVCDYLLAISDKDLRHEMIQDYSAKVCMEPIGDRLYEWVCRAEIPLKNEG